MVKHGETAPTGHLIHPGSNLTPWILPWNLSLPWGKHPPLFSINLYIYNWWPNLADVPVISQVSIVTMRPDFSDYSMSNDVKRCSVIIIRITRKTLKFHEIPWWNSMKFQCLSRYSNYDHGSSTGQYQNNKSRFPMISPYFSWLNHHFPIFFHISMAVLAEACSIPRAGSARDLRWKIQTRCLSLQPLGRVWCVVSNE
jgi:hypothetical protein